MTLTFAAILASAGIDTDDALVVRAAFVREHDDGTAGIRGDSTDEEILHCTRVQEADARRFPRTPPRYWIVMLPEGGDRARLWSVVHNAGEIANDGRLRTFELERSELLARPCATDW